MWIDIASGGLLLLHLLVLHPTLKRELQITVGTAGSQLLAAKLQTVSAMGTAGHQPPAPDLSGHCRTSCCGGGVLVVMMVMLMARIMIMNRNQHK